MAGGTLQKMELGEKIVIVGLFIQIAVFGLFMVVALILNLRLRKTPTAKSLELNNVWRKHLYTLYAASALILIRSVFRAIEYIQGNAGFLLRNEVFLYIFDAVLMLAVMVIFNFVHPSEVKALLKGGNMIKGWKMQSLV